MPDNAIFYYVAYSAIVVLFVGYALSIRVRRNAVARKLAAAEERR
jgi:hypothetical protein